MRGADQLSLVNYNFLASGAGASAFLVSSTGFSAVLTWGAFGVLGAAMNLAFSGSMTGSLPCGTGGCVTSGTVLTVTDLSSGVGSFLPQETSSKVVRMKTVFISSEWIPNAHGHQVLRRR